MQPSRSKSLRSLLPRLEALQVDENFSDTRSSSVLSYDSNPYDGSSVALFDCVICQNPLQEGEKNFCSRCMASSEMYVNPLNVNSDTVLPLPPSEAETFMQFVITDPYETNPTEAVPANMIPSSSFFAEASPSMESLDLPIPPSAYQRRNSDAFSDQKLARLKRHSRNLSEQVIPKFGGIQARPQSNQIDEVLQCENCLSTSTPMWRRDANKRLLCNACGLFRKMRGEDRKVNVIRPKSRSRNQDSAISKYLKFIACLNTAESEEIISYIHRLPEEDRRLHKCILRTKLLDLV